MIKLIVLDVDGTLTDGNRLISTSAIKYIRKGIDKNVTFSLISGNVVPVMFALQTFIGINGPVFAENGGILLYKNQIKKFFDKTRAEKFLEYISKKSSVKPVFTNMWRETSIAFNMDDSDENYVSGEAEKNGLSIVNSRFTWHLMDKNQNKAYAVNYMKDQFELNYDEILVVGDSDNDVPMFNLNVNRACPANATATIKSKSDYVSKHRYGNEMEDVLNHYGIL